jgi:hypothetical protein
LIDGQGRNRTADTLIFSQVLYQLSYLALHNFTTPGCGFALQANMELSLITRCVINLRSLSELFFTSL